MNRPTGWKPNAQAMASVSTRLEFGTRSAELGTDVDSDTWLTPRFILDQLGNFDLDPCACDAIPDWCAPRYFRKDDDGLAQEWAGRVFMNPPFSDVSPWLRKHAAHANGITLVPASVESRTWREIVWRDAYGVLLLHGRTRFCNPDGSSTQGRPLRSIALIAWTPKDAACLQGSSLAGVFFTDWDQR